MGTRRRSVEVGAQNKPAAESTEIAPPSATRHLITLESQDSALRFSSGLRRDVSIALRRNLCLRDHARTLRYQRFDRLSLLLQARAYSF